MWRVLFSLCSLPCVVPEGIGCEPQQHEELQSKTTGGWAGKILYEFVLIPVSVLGHSFRDKNLRPMLC